MTLFFDPCGPLIKYSEGVLHVQNLNPENRLMWCMSRIEMLGLSWRCLVAALRGS